LVVGNHILKKIENILFIVSSCILPFSPLGVLPNGLAQDPLPAYQDTQAAMLVQNSGLRLSLGTGYPLYCTCMAAWLS
jgi:hypothetical protein